MKNQGSSTPLFFQRGPISTAFSLATAACLALSLLASQAQTSGIAPPPGMIGWWPGDGNANDIFGTNNGVLMGGATATAVGEARQAFDLNGTSAYVEVPDSPSVVSD